MTPNQNACLFAIEQHAKANVRVTRILVETTLRLQMVDGGLKRLQLNSREWEIY